MLTREAIGSLFSSFLELLFLREGTAWLLTFLIRPSFSVFLLLKLGFLTGRGGTLKTPSLETGGKGSLGIIGDFLAGLLK